MDTPDHMDARRCTAIAKGTGERCKRRPIPGGTVCVKHGGGAPQVQRKAREWLAALVDPAIRRLGELIRQKTHLPVAMAATKDALDRNGFAWGETNAMHAPTIIVEVNGIARPGRPVPVSFAVPATAATPPAPVGSAPVRAVATSSAPRGTMANPIDADIARTMGYRRIGGPSAEDDQT